MSSHNIDYYEDISELPSNIIKYPPYLFFRMFDLKVILSLSFSLFNFRLFPVYQLVFMVSLCFFMHTNDSLIL